MLSKSTFGFLLSPLSPLPVRQRGIERERVVNGVKIQELLDLLENHGTKVPFQR